MNVPRPKQRMNVFYSKVNAYINTMDIRVVYENGDIIFLGEFS